MSLATYHHKRDFAKTAEPRGRVHRSNHHHFYMQKHAASHLHYDLRLELGGTLKSWAVPKGPSLDPATKRLAIQVEDHPLEYGSFEGTIPAGQYGAGTVMLWDKGYWKPLDKNPKKAYEKGHLRFELESKKLKGRWDLIRFKGEENSWFLIKYKDKYAREQGFEITKESPNSVNKSPMPDWVSPQLASLVSQPPEGKDWLHEVKFDGYRILAFKKGAQVRLMSRNHHDWTAKFHSIAEAIQRLPIKNAIFDGELVLLNKDKHCDFQLLQNSLKSGQDAPFLYYIFDLLYYDKADLRKLPLIERKNLLKPLLDEQATNLIYSDHIQGKGEQILTQCEELVLEGIVSKQSTAQYESGRAKSWLKAKCHKRQELVVGGFTHPKHLSRGFGAVLLGFYDEKGQLIYCGKVGTGFNEASLAEVYNKLKPRIRKTSPFSDRTPDDKTAIWVKPDLIVEVEFSEWTNEGRLRHPSFKGLRFDKNAKTIVKEVELALDEPKKAPFETGPLAPPQGERNVPKLSNPTKILYPGDGITKKQLLHYYEQVAPLLLAYIANRPLTLLRCPENYKSCFFQKKLKGSSSPGLHSIEIKDEKGEGDYIYLDEEEGIFSLVQLNVLEIHPWGSCIDSLDYPDRLIFDLDPAPNVDWEQVVRAAFDVKEHLAQFHLRSFVKTTGGKGLHVVVPVKPEYDWTIIKEFTHAFVQYMEKINPELYLSNMSKAKRKGKIFLDYLRNQYNATAIAAFSTRARSHAPVSTPLAWDELSPDKKDNEYTIKSLPRRLKHLRQDPWENFATIKQSLNLDKLLQ